MNYTDKRQSEVIDELRFPLITFVVFSHVLSFHQEPINFDFSNSMNIYHFVSEMFSHVLGRLPVCCFFIISGYYFFRNFDNLDLSIYKTRMKKRIHGLLIPYLLWNIIFIIGVAIKSFLFSKILGYGNESAFITNNSIYTLLWGMPANFPLWFMRDLFCMSILSPLFYYFFK